jgi:hypothetical protein
MVLQTVLQTVHDTTQVSVFPMAAVWLLGIILILIMECYLILGVQHIILIK